MTKKVSQDLHYKLYKIFLDNAISDFNEYLNVMKLSLKDHVDNLSDDSNRLKADEAVKSNIVTYDSLDMDLIEIGLQGKHYANLLRTSFLVSLYSFMELWLTRECHLQRKQKEGLKLSLSDINGKGLDKIKVYFSKVLNNDFPFDKSKDWEFVTHFKALRNCIVHRQGSLTGHSDLPETKEIKKLKTFVQNEEHLRLFGVGSEIFIEHEFCTKSLVIIHRVMMALLIPKN